ncbi:MAG: cobalt transporter CbiM [Thermoplasmata archaeon]|nr:MAG: cobalt transporter CbiM [Thermoplasmata archaeon]
MHVPDGFIPLWQCAVYFLIIIPFVYLSLRWAEKELDERKIPILGVLAAAIFAIQALNIPIPWGTSGHMVGAAMAAIIIGSPYAGILLLTLVLIVQGFVFGDGGITALGVNIFNMGVISSFVGYYSFKAIKSIKIKPMKDSNTHLMIAAFIGAWLAIFIPAIACAVELWLAGTFPLIQGLLLMGIYHAVIGIVAEGFITATVVVTIATYRSDIFSDKKDRTLDQAVSA